MQEHDYEETPGLPEALPDNEQMLWQGSVDFGSFARGSFHLVKLAVYFGILVVVQFAYSIQQGTPLADAAVASAGYALLAAMAIGLLAGYAWLVSRTAMFTITNRRVVLRTGVAVPVTINLPFSRIDSADLRLRKDGSGDISLMTEPGSRVSWLLLWPMVKPWRFLRVRPVMRGIVNAAEVASLLGDALVAYTRAEPERKPEKPVEKSRPLDSSDTRRFRPYPTVPLAAMVTLVVVAVVGASVGVMNDDGAVARPALVTQVDLFFDDREDGSVVVREAEGGTVVDILEPGTNGFMRATLRTLASERETYATGSEKPFTVGRTESGRILLFDPVSGREIDLRAFGATNAGAFARYLDKEFAVKAREEGASEPAATTIALQQKESTP